MNTKEELEARLEAARKKRAAIAEERDARAQERQLLEQVESEERAAQNEEAISQAESEYGPVGSKILTFESELGVVIVKRPHPIHYKEFRDRAAEAKSEDLEKLVRRCLVHPSADGLTRILDEQPAVLEHLADRCVTLAGFRAKEVLGK